jgi:N,N-dimethylformamidase
VLSIIGYLNNLSFAPGDEVEVKIGSYGAKTYSAELRRIIQGDRNPEGPGYSDELINLDLGQQRIARKQEILPGSYVHIPDRAHILSDLKSFTFATPIYPTRIADGRTCVFTMDGARLHLSIDDSGHLVGELGDARVSLSTPLTLNQWVAVILTYDSSRRRFSLATVKPGTSRPSEEATADAGAWTSTDATGVRIACRVPGKEHFDGKIDSPALFDAALSASEAVLLLSNPQSLSQDPRLVAFWDFSRGMSEAIIHDASPHHLDGAVYQCPARAMTGWRFAGESLDWKIRPDIYSAIHFHSDDISDANWATDFAFTLPHSLTSGIYSVRIVPDKDEQKAYHCVFALRPPRGARSARKICFLMPTASYLAYANHRLGLDVPGTEVGMGRAVEIDQHHAFLQEHPELGFSFYEVHGDGSGVFYSSRNRPVVDIQPGIKGFLGGLGSNVWQFNADTHITGWLNAKGFEFDVITDEDLHREGLSLLKSYQVILTGTHPEYYSERMLDAVASFTDRGGRLMYLGGNGFYWRISFSDHYPGVIECRRSEAGIRPWDPGHGQFYHAFTGEYGGLWRRNGRPSGGVTGVVMSSQGFDISEPYKLTEDASNPRVNFIFEGIETTAGRRIGGFGLSGGGAAGLEIDRADRAHGTPEHALIMASSTHHTDIYLMVPEDILDPTPDMSGTQSPLIRADMTFFETRGGGAVFSTSSIAWAGAMAWNGYDNEISKITENVLRRFQNQAPFRHC